MLGHSSSRCVGGYGENLHRHISSTVHGRESKEGAILCQQSATVGLNNIISFVYSDEAYTLYRGATKFLVVAKLGFIILFAY